MVSESKPAIWCSTDTHSGVQSATLYAQEEALERVILTPAENGSEQSSKMPKTVGWNEPPTEERSPLTKVLQTQLVSTKTLQTQPSTKPPKWK